MPRHWKRETGCVITETRRWVSRHHRACTKFIGSQESVQEPSTQGITNENTTCTELEPEFWNMVKRQTSIPWGNAIYFTVLSVWVTVFSTTQYFYCRGQLLRSCFDCRLCYLIISQTCAGFLWWEPSLFGPLHSKSPHSSSTIPDSTPHLHYLLQLCLHPQHNHYLHFCMSYRQRKRPPF